VNERDRGDGEGARHCWGGLEGGGEKKGGRGRGVGRGDDRGRPEER